MYYLLEAYYHDKWQPVGFILEGDIHMHTKVMEEAKKVCGYEYRCRRVSETEAENCVIAGMRLMHAPN